MRAAMETCRSSASCCSFSFKPWGALTLMVTLLLGVILGPFWAQINDKAI